VDHLALEVIDPVDPGRLRIDERPDGADHEPRGDLLAGDVQPPEMVVLVPGPRADSELKRTCGRISYLAT